MGEAAVAGEATAAAAVAETGSREYARAAAVGSPGLFLDRVRMGLPGETDWHETT